MTKKDLLPHTGLLDEVTGTCLLTRTRRLSRVVTNIYDQALQHYGINSPQFSLLVLIWRLDGATRSEIGRINGQERSTLSRNLALLLDRGFVHEGEADGRRRPITISEEGIATLLAAAPGWRAAQIEAGEILGKDGVSSILAVGDLVEKLELS